MIPTRSGGANSSNPQHRVTVIICTLNEEQNIVRAIPKIPRFVEEVILVDGHSSDKTVEVARRLMPEITVLIQQGKGKGDALRHGFEAAKGDIIVTLDADGSTDPQEMSDFIRPLLNGYDFAKGTRLARGKPTTMKFDRWLGNILIVGFTNLLFGTKFTDMCSGYNAFWRKCLPAIHFTGDLYEDEPLMILRATKAGLRIVEVATKYDARILGESKSPALRQGWKSIKTSFRERLVWSYNPHLLKRFQIEFEPVDKLITKILGYLVSNRKVVSVDRNTSFPQVDGEEIKSYLDVGCGDNPHPQADVLCDLQVGKRKDKPFVVCAACHLAFQRKSFRHVNCIAVMEHVEDPSALLRELKRVAEHGYIEAPSRILENVLIGWKDHKWIILNRRGKLFCQRPHRMCLGWVRVTAFDERGMKENKFMLPLGLLIRTLAARFGFKERVFKGREKRSLPFFFTRYSF